MRSREPWPAGALQQSLHLTFWAMLGIGVFIVLFSSFVPHVALGRAKGPGLEAVAVEEG